MANQRPEDTGPQKIEGGEGPGGAKAALRPWFSGKQDSSEMLPQQYVQ